MGSADQHLETLKRIVNEYLADFPVKVYLIGSRARGTAKPTSDVDIAYLPLEALPPALLEELNEVFVENAVPYKIDWVDLSEIEPVERQRLLIGAKLWKA